MPDFVKGMNQVIADQRSGRLKTYLRWQTVHAAAPMLPKAFVDENFNFYGKTLTGAKEIRPRWKRCVQFTDGDLGEALGKAYVAEDFPPESKAAHAEDGPRTGSRAEDRHHRAFLDDADETKKQALDKLSHIANKIGYPDKWRDYSTLTIVRGDALGNVPARQSVRVQPPAQQDRQAGGPQRVGHDAAHRQRLLQSAGEQHQLPGGHSAAAVLRSQGRRCRELRRNRRGHRPRTHARLRR